MIICISGLSGSGKNSVGKLVADKLRLRLIDPTFKTIAAKQKMSLLDFHKKAEHEHSIDKKFDDALIASTKGGNCVVCTWLGPWMIKNADIRVWLYAPSAARATRVAKRDGMAVDEASRHIAERDESNRLRYLDIYTIDIYDHSGFDLVINSEIYKPEQSSEIIVAAALSKKGAAKKTEIKKSKKKK
ncbi:MAG: cytidylate kinase family protein [Candidatus Micrarchaeota archaeon]|nr:cytidylate kinase family protein [Candidatus Micrarchaeota archaeon]